MQGRPPAAVFIESFRPGVLEKMGLSPEVLLERNPRLVILRISGWGQNGPYHALVHLVGRGLSRALLGRSWARAHFCDLRCAVVAHFQVGIGAARISNYRF